MNERLEKEDAALVAIAFHCISHVAADRQMGETSVERDLYANVRL